jgi:hypothetical protein
MGWRGMVPRFEKSGYGTGHAASEIDWLCIEFVFFVLKSESDGGLCIGFSFSSRHPLA